MRRLLLVCTGYLLVFGVGISSASDRSDHFRFIDPGDRRVRFDVEIVNNLVLVPIRINRTLTLDFILDTGVKTTLLTEPLLTGFIGLDTSKVRPIQVRGLGEGERIRALRASGVRLALPGIVGDSMNMIVLPEGAVSYSGMFGRPIAGILGYDLFRDFVVEINYYRKYLRLTRREHFRPRRRDVAQPIVLRNGKPYLRAQIIDARQDTFSRMWLLDTGASQGISIYQPDLEPPERNLRALIGYGLSGPLYGRIARLEALIIGPFRLEAPVAGYLEMQSLRWLARRANEYSNIGAEVLSRFNLTFDYAGRKVYMRPTPGFSKPFLYSTSGVEVQALGPTFDRYYVSYVRAESPAERAGVQEGDELLSVNGRQTQELEIGDVYQMLERRPGKRLCLRIMRLGERQKICYETEAGI